MSHSRCTLTTHWPWVLSIRQNLLALTEYDDVSTWVKNSREGRETTSKRANTLNLFNQFPFHSNLHYFVGAFPIVIVFLLLTIKGSLAAKCIHPPFTRFIYKKAMQTTASAGATQHFLLYPEVLFRRKLRTPYPTACLHLWRFYINCVINGFAVNSTIIIAKIKEIRGQLSRCIMLRHHGICERKHTSSFCTV